MNLMSMAKRIASSRLPWIALAVVTITLCTLGILHKESIADWQIWIDQRSALLRIWRIALYACTAYVWWRMRTRLRLDPLKRQRLLRAEISAVTLLLITELQMLGQELSFEAIP